MRQFSGRLGLLGRFSILSLAAFVLLGLVLAHTLQGQVRDRSLANARQTAEILAKFGIQPRVSPVDLSRGLSARKIRTLDDETKSSGVRARVTRIKLWTRAGKVVYSDDRQLIGRRFPASEELETAFRGRIASEVSNAKKIENAGEHGFGRLLEVYVPLRFGSRSAPSGAFEIYMPYGPIAATIKRDTRKLYLFLFGGLALLYAALFRIVASASKRLRRQAAQNRHQALHDALTGLPNRTLFHDRVEQALAAGKRNRQEVGVLLIDLDRFKEVNDTLGHRKGDLLLREIGSRLRATLRESDTIARLGGDEFGVLLPAIENSAGATRSAARIRESLEHDFVVDGLRVTVDTSVGIALAPQHGSDVDTLLQHADVAMYQAKRAHAGYGIYAAETDPYSPVQLAMVGELRKAFEGDDEVVLHYQPKMDLQSGGIQAVEALVRWQHPERGLIPPNDFIPMAEHTGLIRPLTRYVLNAALAQCREWQDTGLELAISVNISARNLLDPCLPEDVERLLAKWGVKPELLALELTETTIMVDPKRALEVLNRLSSMGIALSIDDFGTGYSSLSHLRDLPVDELKIDRSFVMTMHSNESDAFIVRSTIELGHNLGLRVVAEGVEDEGALLELSDLGCDLAQGYFLSRPLPAKEFESWLSGRERLAGTSGQVA
jgi:diguanylate cyclase (GGDEF)-like protein